MKLANKAQESLLMSSLDAFLELKLENERLREELREAQAELDDEDLRKWYWQDPSPRRHIKYSILSVVSYSSTLH